MNQSSKPSHTICGGFYYSRSQYLAVQAFDAIQLFPSESSAKYYFLRLLFSVVLADIRLATGLRAGKQNVRSPLQAQIFYKICPYLRLKKWSRAHFFFTPAVVLGASGSLDSVSIAIAVGSYPTSCAAVIWSIVFAIMPASTFSFPALSL
jgi:hypothetical protein